MEPDFVIEKTATELWPVEAPLLILLGHFWRPETDYALNDTRLPTDSNGYQFKASNAGRSGAVEPKEFQKKGFRITVGDSVVDGSITWVAEVASATSRDSIASVNTVVPTGLTVSAPTISGTVVSFNVSGGAVGQKYRISIEYTFASGEIVEHKIDVLIKDE